MNPISRRTFILAAGAALLSATGLPAHASGETLELWKTPWCGCCTAWVDHMRAAGFEVRVTELEDLEPVKTRLGVTPELASCHTGLIGGYVIEGHVPAADVARLLKEKPQATGLAVPGMPIGSPGMEMGDRKDAYDVLLFDENGTEVFSHHPGN